MKRILIENAVIVNEGRKVPGSVVIEGEKIAEILVNGQHHSCLCRAELRGGSIHAYPYASCARGCKMEAI